MIKEIFKRNWLSTVYMFVVFVGSFTVIVKLKGVAGTRWWFAVIFFVMLYFASLFEITIKPGLKQKRGLGKITFEAVLIWFLPLCVGYAASIHVK